MYAPYRALQSESFAIYLGNGEILEADNKVRREEVARSG